ncbi:MAG: methyltransferase [Cyclobacteriaceae bacterium]
MRNPLFIYFLILVSFIGGCSYTSSPVRSGYHNVTAHYNAYWIAQERMNEIESSIYDKYQWNYNKILPIFVPIDSNDAKSLETQIEDCIQKASIAIQRHPDSNWEDDSYVLVGKARYYSLEFADAIETFKYVNKHSDNDDSRHEALIELIKSFVDFDEINNAIAVSDYMKKEKLSKKNQKELSLVRAYLFQKRKDLDQMVQHLVAAESFMTRSVERARMDFIIGQVYQKLGFESEAYNYYSSCLKNSPEYELEFYTKLNMAQVTQLTSSSDVKKTRKYFKKLLKDSKNVEYRDKIYYEMANFEVKQGNLDQAIAFYKLSTQSSVKNERQKAYSYLKLGQIYYDSLRNFVLAQNYYDSTVATMPKDEENYAKIKQRQEILNDFITQLLTIQNNDSLISLSKLPKDSIIAIATSVVKDKMEQEKAKQLKEERKAANRAQSSAFDQGGGALIGTSFTPGSIWYFYNPSLIGSGSSEFKRIWGARTLEDNWRRSQKAGGQGSSENLTEDESDLEQEEISEDELIAAEVTQMVAAVPSSQEEVDALLLEVEEALYKLGIIYNFNLEEKSNAILSFESFLLRFPDSEHEPEVLYQLYLLYKVSDPALAEERSNLLKEKYPDSIFAKLVDNPNYREESYATTEQLKKVYARAYNLYRNQNYQESQYLIDSALLIHPENDFSDNLALLNIMNMGNLDGQIKYQFELSNFPKTYPNSELVPYAQSLEKASEDFQINLYNSAKAKFVAYFGQKHYLVVVYPNNDDLTSAIPLEVEEFILSKNYGLTTGNLILDEDHALVLVNEFPAKGSASSFLNTLNTELNIKDLHKGEKIYSFVITEDNFDIFYQTRDIDSYLNFFEKHYQQ